MPSAYGPIFVRCRTNIYYCPAHTALFLSDVGLIYTNAQRIRPDFCQMSDKRSYLYYIYAFIVYICNISYK